MKKENMIYALLDVVDDKFIDEASPDNAEAIRRSKRIKNTVIKSTAIAACFVCATVIGIGIYNLPPEPPVSVIDPGETNPSSGSETLPTETTPTETSAPSLPLIDINDALTGIMGMGYEGYKLYDISELLTGNAMECGTLEKLSVYQNNLTYDERMKPSGQDLDKMLSWLTETAEKLGMDLSSLTIKDNIPTEKELQQLEKEFQGRYQSSVPDYYLLPTMYSVEDDRFYVEVTAEMTLTIRFKNTVATPEEYAHISYTNSEQMEGYTSCLWAEYGYLVGYENPDYFIKGGLYDIYSTQSYELYFYDIGKGDGPRESFENAALNNARFYISSEGEVTMIRIYALGETLDKLGEYPLIDREEAEARLLRGEFYSSLPSITPQKENIHHVEIVYNGGSYNLGGNAKIIMPFYKFYVELPEKREGDMKVYGTCYVPALADEVLK